MHCRVTYEMSSIFVVDTKQFSISFHYYCVLMQIDFNFKTALLLLNIALPFLIVVKQQIPWLLIQNIIEYSQPIWYNLSGM